MATNNRRAEKFTKAYLSMHEKVTSKQLKH
ncbi:UNVERIFIED_ORG: hypothetical protein M2154_000710 [Enterobacter sp. JUb101]|jgi:hypothetical protein|nr:hypothetical protein [Lelliottia amnigena]